MQCKVVNTPSKSSKSGRKKYDKITINMWLFGWETKYLSQMTLNASKYNTSSTSSVVLMFHCSKLFIPVSRDAAQTPFN